MLKKKKKKEKKYATGFTRRRRRRIINFNVEEWVLMMNQRGIPGGGWECEWPILKWEEEEEEEEN